MPNRMNLWDFEVIDWDDEEAEGSNLAHCLESGIDEQVVSEVLGEEPVEVKMHVVTAEFAIVRPNSSRSKWWAILFDWSVKRGDWFRPVTGWDAQPEGKIAWERGRTRR